MNRWLRWIGVTVSACCVAAGAVAWASAQGTQEDKHGKADAERMIRAAEGTLAPVYAPLAEEIVQRLDLGDTQGMGIDLGSGPGTLIVELCKRTKLHWINADINPHFFTYFFEKAAAGGYSGRVSAMQADACTLPFRDNLVDVVVSRGSFQFWPDLREGLAEVYRVLKPGGIAYIGRGLPETLPLETARQMRSEQGKDMKYDPAATEQQFREIVQALGIKDYRIHRPRPAGSEGVNYGIWLQFRKPKIEGGRAEKQ